MLFGIKSSVSRTIVRSWLALPTLVAFEAYEENFLPA
jgi:hypothetical protein